MGTKTEALKIAARSAFYIGSRAFGFAALGGVINLGMLVVLWPQIYQHVHVWVPNGGGHAAAALLPLIVIASLWQSLPAIFLTALFLLGFPVTYFLFGKKHGVQVAMTKFLKDKKSDLLIYFLAQLFDRIKARPELLQKVQTSGAVAALREIIPAYIAKLDDLPRPMRFLLRIVLRKVNIDGIVMLLEESKELDALDVDRISAATRTKLNDFLDERFFTPSLVPLFALLGGNVVAFVLVKLLA